MLHLRSATLVARKIVGLAMFQHDANDHTSMPSVTELSAHFLAACRSKKNAPSQQRKLS
jgi:hypothetical protein